MSVRKSEVKVEWVPLASLKAYDGNAKKHDSANIDAIANSIEEFGFRNPVLAWHNEDGIAEIVAGHGRAAAAKKLRMETVPVVFVDDLSDAQRRMLTLADNQTTLMTGWDEAQLAEELDALRDVFSIEDYGFDAREFGEEPDLDSLEESEPDDNAPERVKKGDLWRMGEHVLLCGDSTDPASVGRVMAEMGGMADLLLTDPPYNVALGHHMRALEAKQLHRRTDGLVIDNDAFDSDEAFIEFLETAFTAALSGLKAGGAFYVWYASTQSRNFLAAAERAGMVVRQILVWAKDTFALGRQDYQWRHELCLYGWRDGAAHYFTDSRRETTVVEEGVDTSKMTKDELKAALDGILGMASTVLREKKPTKSIEHPTMKPVKLFAYQMCNSSRPGEIVLDPFGGSGTSVIAAEQTGRRCATIELDEHYASVIVDRWERLTGEQAVKVG